MNSGVAHLWMLLVDCTS